MKKTIAIILSLILGISMLSACGGGLEDPPPLPPPRVREATAPSPIFDPPPDPVTDPTEPDTSDPDDPIPGASDADIPGNGGTFIVEQPTEFTFIPAQSGAWEFFTSDNGNSDPYLELYGGDFGGLIWEDDDSGEGNNALITRVLAAGAEYTVNARFWGSNDSGSFTLTVRRIEPQVIPGDGGIVNVDGETYFIFIPNESGMWEFLTSDNGDSDPKLHIYDTEGVELYDDDDGAGDGANALINARLESGTTYFIRATFFWDFDGRYTLSVTQQD